MCFSPSVWRSYLKGEGPLGEGAEAVEAAAAHWSLRPKHKERLMIMSAIQRLLLLRLNEFRSEIRSNE